MLLRSLRFMAGVRVARTPAIPVGMTECESEERTSGPSRKAVPTRERVRQEKPQTEATPPIQEARVGTQQDRPEGRPLQKTSRPEAGATEWSALVGCGLFLRDYGFYVQAQAFGYAFAVGWVGFVEMLDLEFLDAARDAITEAAGDIVDEALFGIGWH
jgi:hypothetical protein